MAPGRPFCSRLGIGISRVFGLDRIAAAELPIYLCPAFRSLSFEITTRNPRISPDPRRIQTRRLHVEYSHPPQPEIPKLREFPERALPLQCHGCGALAQTVEPDKAGYYNLNRKAIRKYLGLEEEKPKPHAPDPTPIIESALKNIDVDALEKQGIYLKSLLPKEPEPEPPKPLKPPLCERCHNLVHHSSAKPIFHPSIESLRDTIEESPYKRNHVYHVIDAADFPMSLLPRLHSLLDISLRSRNRRSEHAKYKRGRLMEMSFIITRSDLLAPRKEQVDKMMPYFKEVLRDALGRVGHRIRLGNVHCVSAKRSWWTKELKEKIYERGGAGWMVGKVNVGKSQLFEAVFPKGRMVEEPSKHDIKVTVYPKKSPHKPEKPLEALPGLDEDDDHGYDPSDPLLPGRVPEDDLENLSLLPPPMPETNYPEMPVVSSLPGTTASPIRVPFGSGRGELIDLPGLARSDLENFVQEDKRQDLILKARVVPKQQVIKPGQSLVLGGGLIRITPRNVAADGDEELIFLGYAFTPLALAPHLTSTSKAIALQAQSPDAPHVDSIMLPGVGEKIKHAGAFQLRYDVTKARTGPLTRKEAVGLKVDRLPYRVLGIDILIEGCGWVELAVQVRTKSLFREEERKKLREIKEQLAKQEFDGTASAVSALPETLDGELLPGKLDLRPEPVNAVDRTKKRKKAAAKEEEEDGMDEEEKKKKEEEEEEEEEEDWDGLEPKWPVVDVYSPEGRFIGYRKPMNAWLMNKPKKPEKSRPRPSMKGRKKEEKKMKRMLAAQQAA
ncbi:uncharacterized protein CTHT_0008650 [Thermochaetoides thermophila DSM 1495]|uniref:Genetic interactor of prohibitins 3, mitochondrial n=1 Tax=Chaetomium thermophilum (strain DSM 1495 / CBS 144.50 / IMI 039719) TaxID=759272 RepID=G0S041_CHATD|nr:hypothetical protein CTHT_0008650 [Thermochaetoides thermophila DSM 1495]EGS23202.1 hypothetical protein CTHT_0008650 [Thermochaetoides thermophila DSM 1495]